MGLVRKPRVSVDRRKQGNTHGTITPYVIVLHDTECGDRPGTGDVSGVLQYLERTPDKLGVHFVVDAGGNVGQGAGIFDMCYHARGINGRSVGIEQIGFASFTFTKWWGRRAQLDKVAKLLAWLSLELDIPLVHSTDRGVCMHKDVPEGGHHDPGSSYPFRRVLKRARKYRAEGW